MVAIDSDMNVQLDTAPLRPGNYTDLCMNEYNQLEYLNLAIFNSIFYIYIYIILFCILLDRKTIFSSCLKERSYKASSTVVDSS